MKKLVLLALAAALPLTFVAPSLGADLVYTPINPAFGGNPGNSSHLLAAANAQRTATASDAPITSSGGSGTGSGGSGSTTSNADLFISQLQGRLLSALASQVTEAIFGPSPQDHGTITFGDTTVVFDNSGASINLTITDTLTGQVTVISVPKLVVTP